jgi:crotonobetainyl-CoA:carnitine CoA-transferase CaiB-like acyl-CoA transferase
VEKHAFSGTRIIDCTQGIGGPYCTKLLADFGADVIKVESPDGGDAARRMGPFLNDEPHPEKSALFFYLNTNKKSVTLNLDVKAGVDLFKRLLQGADVVVENLGPGRMSALGLSDEILKQVQHNVLVTHISPFGGSGPYRDYKASNLTLYGLGGAMYTMRAPEKPLDRPVLEGGLQTEYITGLLSFIATVAAMLNRECKGQGTEIDMGSMEAVSSVLAAHISEYSYMGLSRRTNPWPIHGYPIGYSSPCRDGWISLTPGMGGTPNIATLIEKPDLKDSPLFSKPSARMAEPEKFDAIIQPWMKEHDKWEITRMAQALRLAFTPILTPKEILEDAQLKAREYFSSSDHPTMGNVTYPGAPAKLSETPWRKGRAPLLGEHNKDIYGSLRCTRKDLVRMREEGVI